MTNIDTGEIFGMWDGEQAVTIRTVENYEKARARGETAQSKNDKLSTISKSYWDYGRFFWSMYDTATTLFGHLKPATLTRLMVLGTYMSYDSKAMGAMTSSAGAMSSANSVYMESVGAKADRMKASFQEFASTLLDSDIVGLLYDIGNGALNAVSAFDAWPAKIALVAAGLPTLIGLFRELRHMPLIESIGGSFKDLARPKMTGRNWNWANHLEEAA